MINKVIYLKFKKLKIVVIDIRKIKKKFCLFLSVKHKIHPTNNSQNLDSGDQNLVDSSFSRKIKKRQTENKKQKKH